LEVQGLWIMKGDGSARVARFNGEGWIMKGNGSARVAGIDHMETQFFLVDLMWRLVVEEWWQGLEIRLRWSKNGGNTLLISTASSALALHVLRRLGSIFTSVYVAVQKLKKAFAKSFSSAWLTISSWTMSISLTEVEMKCFTSRRFTRRQKDCFMSKGINQSLWEKVLLKLV
ncbi:hypothetical protein Tco_1077144, partial [Tanacetum coccineum]